jgi:serine/threonine protein kinase
MGFDGTSGWLPPGIEHEKAFNEKYLIERELGIGGSGLVVCARHRALDARVAIKFLLPSSEPARAIARFQFEARAAKRLKNGHVVRIDDIATLESGVPYMVMEYLDGADLDRTLRQTPNRQLPVSDAIDFVLQAGEAVAESHSLGIVHRDLKPSNLFCVHGPDGLPMIKVLDFGISKVTSAPGAITMGGQMLGSPQYMSPEQYESAADVDLRTDIWSFGVILYEFLTGQPPFVGNDPFALRQRVRQMQPAPMIELRRDLPREVGPIVFRCLEKDPNKRYSNLAELAKALWSCSPPRSRASVACIVRTLESPGCTTSSLVLSRQDAPRSESTTVDGVAATRRRVRQWGKTLPMVVGAIAVVGTIIAVRDVSRTARPPFVVMASQDEAVQAPIGKPIAGIIPSELATGTPLPAATSSAPFARSVPSAPSVPELAQPAHGTPISRGKPPAPASVPGASAPAVPNARVAAIDGEPAAPSAIPESKQDESKSVSSGSGSAMKRADSSTPRPIVGNAVIPADLELRPDGGPGNASPAPRWITDIVPRRKGNLNEQQQERH